MISSGLNGPEAALEEVDSEMAGLGGVDGGTEVKEGRSDVLERFQKKF